MLCTVEFISPSEKWLIGLETRMKVPLCYRAMRVLELAGLRLLEFGEGGGSQERPPAKTARGLPAGCGQRLDT